jgi:hypothetical protein
VGLDRGLAAFAVAAMSNGTEVGPGRSSNQRPACLEDSTVANPIANRNLASAIGDAVMA